MGPILLGGVPGLVVVGVVVIARVVAESRSEPALGERYVPVADSDSTIDRSRQNGRNVGGGIFDGDGDGGGDGGGD